MTCCTPTPSQVSPPTYFPWGHSSPRRDKSGKLLARRRLKPRPPQNKVRRGTHRQVLYLHTQFQSIVEHMERVGRREQLLAHCTHPFTHGCELTHSLTHSHSFTCLTGSKCQLRGGSPEERTDDPVTSTTTRERIAKVSGRVSPLAELVEWVWLSTAESEPASHWSAERGRGETEGEEEREGGGQGPEELAPHPLGGRLPEPAAASPSGQQSTTMINVYPPPVNIIMTTLQQNWSNVLYNSAWM